MLAIIPRLHELVGSSASRNLAQLRELGVEAAERGVRVAVRVEPVPTPGRWLLATTLADMLLRLDPLVGEVRVSAPGMDEEALRSDLATHLPLVIADPDGDADFTVGVGTGAGTADLLVDAAGWVASIGEPARAADDGNPVGPLAGAALATAEVFKWAFAVLYPERTALLEMAPWRGRFSFFSYDLDGASPPLPDVCIATTLVGAGGVGAGLIRTIAALGGRVGVITCSGPTVTTNSGPT